MTPLFTATTVSISIERCPSDVYAFIADPRNMPVWATSFCRAVSRTAAGWATETPDGQLPIRFVAPNAFGVLDHYVGPGPGLAAARTGPTRRAGGA